MITTHNITTDSHKLVALTSNPDRVGIPIILLHGITSSVHIWTAEEQDLFLPYGPTYALSLPGHYPAYFPTGFRTETLTAEMMAEVLSAAVRHLAQIRNHP